MSYVLDCPLSRGVRPGIPEPRGGFAGRVTRSCEVTPGVRTAARPTDCRYPEGVQARQHEGAPFRVETGGLASGIRLRHQEASHLAGGRRQRRDRPETVLQAIDRNSG